MKVLKLPLIGLILLLVFAPTATRAGCGDLDRDGTINVLDIIAYIDILFVQHGEIPLELGDINGDGTINVLDVVALIFYKYQCISDCGQFLNCPIYDHAEVSSGCLDAGDKGDIVFEVNGTSLTIYHNGAFYNCCLEYFVDYYIQSGTIRAREMDFGDLCDCYCDFDLYSTLNDIEPGTYLVSFYGIEGDLLHEETLEFGSIPELIGSTQSECLPPFKGSVQYDYSNGVLHLAHDGVEFNCTAEWDGIGITFELSGDTLRFIETNLTDETIPVPCMCDFDLTADVANIAPGNYVAEVYCVDITDEGPLLLDRRNLVLE